MPIEITMPRLSDTMEEGTLIKWRVKPGDAVKSGDLLADVETDKATMELQSYDDGTVAQIAVGEGQTVPVGKLILLVAAEGESVDDAIAAAGSDDAAGGGGDDAPSPGGLGGSNGGGTATLVARPPGSVKVSPLARKLAEEHHVDLATIAGSGPAGRIIKRDVLAAAKGGSPTGAPLRAPVVVDAPSPAAPVRSASLEAAVEPVSNMRRTIARRLVESKTTIPHFTVTVSVDMQPLDTLRTTLNEQLASSAGDAAPVKLSVNDFIVRATALALVEHPVVNSSWTDAGIEKFATVNIGVAVSLPEEKGGGLVVPTIRDAHAKGLRAISAETRSLATKAREQGLTVEEMSDGTFTLSNLGMFQVEHFEAIINPPQAAILAVGSAVRQPVVRDGQVVAGLQMSMTLSADHRVVDGASAAQFLQTLKTTLENPAVLLV